VAYREYQRIVSLPLYPRMSDQDVEDVVEAVCDVVRKYKR
jgi:dTDP-4-amino-4,6-dideoxygalactose transaminase